MRGMTKGKAALLAGAAALVGSAMWGGPAQAEDITINMAAPDWPPTRIMQDMANASYNAPSGNTVTLVIDFIPWPDYYTRLAASLTSGEEKYQMAVSDSQWLGANIEGGYYMKINDFIDADPGSAGGVRGSASQPRRVLFHLSASVGELLRLPADAGRAGGLLP